MDKVFYGSIHFKARWRSSVHHYCNLCFFNIVTPLENCEEMYQYASCALHQVQRAVASAMVAFLSTANNMQASGAVSAAPEPQSAGDLT